MPSEPRREPERYPPIGAYAVIGDCHTAALISRDGSVDWYCPVRFDAPALLCRLLDADRGGFLSVAPAGGGTATRRYRGPTNVLEMTFATPGGRVRVTDCMPIEQRGGGRRGNDVLPAHRLLRLIGALDGDADVELRFRPSFDYARARAQLEIAPPVGVVARAGDQHVTLACTGGVRGRLRLMAGEQRWVVLTHTADPRSLPAALAPGDCAELVRRTLAYWERWAARCTFTGPYRATVLRSALALKLLTYEPTGALVAAPTTSLPEQLGGPRNWDYRYTWLRDTALILYALMTVGYRDEAADFFEWLDRTCGDGSRAPRIMYAIDGRTDLAEATLDHLEGYRGSRPVRIGNAAATQRQLDIFGEVLSAAYLRYRRGGADRRPASRDGRPEPPDEPERPSTETWSLLRGLVDQAAERWREPDRGIWEVRGGAQQFLYGKLMCWAALDRGIRLADEHGLLAPLDRWRRTRREVRRAILARGFDGERGTFTQAFGSAALDASALAIPRVGFLPPTDPRVQSTVERIRTELTHDGLVYRYRTRDGLPGGEGTFALCTFWLVDALALGGRLDEAHDLFARAVGYANDVGLLSEEIDPATGELLGNFPQGFTHLALIGAAVNLAKAGKHGAEARSENEAERADRAHRAAAEGYAARPSRHTGRGRAPRQDG